MPKLTIFRGLPGSGKSTQARELSAKTGAILIEPDMFCIRNGEYEWSEEIWEQALSIAHWALGIFSAGAYSDIIYADVLPQESDVIEIIDQIPADYRYSVEVIDNEITVEESMRRNIHNVPMEDLMRMERDWEPWRS